MCSFPAVDVSFSSCYIEVEKHTTSNLLLSGVKFDLFLCVCDQEKGSATFCRKCSRSLWGWGRMWPMFWFWLQMAGPRTMWCHPPELHGLWVSSNKNSYWIQWAFIISFASNCWKIMVLFTDLGNANYDLFYCWVLIIMTIYFASVHFSFLTPKNKK